MGDVDLNSLGRIRFRLTKRTGRYSTAGTTRMELLWPNEVFPPGQFSYLTSTRSYPNTSCIRTCLLITQLTYIYHLPPCHITTFKTEQTSLPFPAAYIIPTMRPLTAPDYVCTAQGLFLLFNGVYILLNPSAAAAPSSPLAGTTASVMHVIRFPLTSFP